MDERNKFYDLSEENETSQDSNRPEMEEIVSEETGSDVVGEERNEDRDVPQDKEEEQNVVNVVELGGKWCIKENKEEKYSSYVLLLVALREKGYDLSQIQGLSPSAYEVALSIWG